MKKLELQIGPFESLTLQNVLYVPKISYNLLFISKITKDGTSVLATQILNI